MSRKHEDKQSEKARRGVGIARSLQLFFRNLRLYYRICREAFYSLILSSFFSAVSPYVTIYLTALLVNELVTRRNFHALMMYVALILGTTAVLKLVGAVMHVWKNYSNDLLVVKKSVLFMEKRLSLDYVDIDSQETYDLLTRIEQNENFLGFGMYMSYQNLEALLGAVFQVLGGVVLSVTLFTTVVPAGSEFDFLDQPLIVIGVILGMLMFTFLSPYLYGQAESYWTKYNEIGTMGNRYFGFFGFMGTRPARALDIRMYEQHDFCKYYIGKEDAFGVDSKIANYAKGPMGMFAALSEMMSVALLAVIYTYTCLKAYAGAFGIGEVTQYIGATTALFIGLQELLKSLTLIRHNGEFIDLAFRFLDIPNKMYQGSLTTEKRTDSNYEIEFRNVSFKYPGTEDYALRNVSIKFHCGSKLAVVGMNGSGKTTFIKLLCRLYDPDEGEILLNGINIRKYNYREYLDIFSVVFQDYQIFSFTLGDNIAMAENYDKDAVKDVLERVGFGERLKKLPKGTDTYCNKTLDDEGVEFSGGESQKIAIARALYKNSPFIILDEP
ncbi:MAG: ABC transporter ATP-binding protein, partial [Bacillota bacterium]|nr:ABC transporter ATP-binding protein [Bacillota bacterium]